jgi:hypothetical protein
MVPDVGVCLGRADVGVAEDALDRADVDALLQYQRGRGVPSVVQAHLPNAGALRQLAHSAQSARGSIGRPFGWQNTRSQSSHVEIRSRP